MTWKQRRLILIGSSLGVPTLVVALVLRQETAAPNAVRVKAGAK
jgi:hypothetical protein